jgi:hypothetical protein
MTGGRTPVPSLASRAFASTNGDDVENVWTRVRTARVSEDRGTASFMSRLQKAIDITKSENACAI